MPKFVQCRVYDSEKSPDHRYPRQKQCQRKENIKEMRMENGEWRKGEKEKRRKGERVKG